MTKRLRSTLVLLILLLVMVWAVPVPAAPHGGKAPEKRAILLVTFGTSVPEAQKVFAGIEKYFQEDFRGVDIFWAYTAEKIRKKLAAQGQELLSPEEALARLMAQGYTKVGVQSLHVIPGEEYTDLARVVDGFRSMSHQFHPILSPPLCNGSADLLRIRDILLANLPKERQPGEAVLYMGHGTPHAADMAYPALAYLLEHKDPLVYVATVEGYPALDDVLPLLKAKGVKKVWLLPFMTVAGDHAHNDMAGPEPDSWKSLLAAQGIEAVPVMKAISEIPAIVEIWAQHLQKAAPGLYGSR
ncbi:MAG: sirohydrochlorin cobaltochelatase [Deltaproteobacteria bacterium]|nr:sirohydrochlorin cobaltochelatase [Deltaproteobacteria bacterium]